MGFEINPEEWGRIKQQIEDIHEDIRGDLGILEQLRRMNGRLRVNEIKVGILFAGGGVVVAVITILKFTGHI